VTDTPAPTLRRPARPPQPHFTPRGTTELGMVLFLAALGVLFASTMLGYVIVRITKTRQVVRPGTDEVVREATAPALGSIHMPAGLWVSTLIILASSVAIHQALTNVRRERQHAFRTWLIVTAVLSVLFCLVQLPSMMSLLFGHFDAGAGNTMLGLIFVLILLHALHVVGGMVPLGVIAYRAGQGKYDHEHYRPVKSVAMYWHFLDAIWLFMFAVLLVTG
jgi:heme/copper-type cytochrome/quinol oxidase subunit 3